VVARIAWRLRAAAVVAVSGLTVLALLEVVHAAALIIAVLVGVLWYNTFGWRMIWRERQRAIAAAYWVCPDCGYDIEYGLTRCLECGEAFDIEESRRRWLARVI
jgi:hypothetical protein